MDVKFNISIEHEIMMRLHSYKSIIRSVVPRKLIDIYCMRLVCTSVKSELDSECVILNNNALL